MRVGERLTFLINSGFVVALGSSQTSSVPQ